MNIDVRTIYLTRDYKKDYRNYRTKFLEEWEKRHREFLQNLAKTDSALEKIIMDRLIPIHIEINDIKIVITDTVTSNSIKKIAINIKKITSDGCNINWDPIVQQEDDKIRRNFEVSKFFVNIFNEKFIKDDDHEAGKKLILILISCIK